MNAYLVSFFLEPDSEVMTEITSSLNNEKLIMDIDRLDTGMEYTEEPDFLESKFRETAHLGEKPHWKIMCCNMYFS